MHRESFAMRQQTLTTALFILLISMPRSRGRVERYVKVGLGWATVSPGKFADSPMGQPVQATDPPGVTRVFHVQQFVENPFQQPSVPVDVYYAVLERPCRSVMLHAPSEAAQIVRGASPDVRDGTYNLSISWYRMGSDCAIPFSVMEFSECPYTSELANCPVRNQPRWQFYGGFSAPTEDNLGLLMHAPAIETGGLYTRLIKVNQWVEVTQFILEHHGRGPCVYALPLYIPPLACLTNREFAKGVTVDAIGMVPKFIPENQRIVVEYSLKVAGWKGPRRPYGSTRLPPEVAAGLKNATAPPLTLGKDTSNPLLDEEPAAPHMPPNWHQPPINPDPEPEPTGRREYLVPVLTGAAGVLLLVATLSVIVYFSCRKKLPRVLGGTRAPAGDVEKLLEPPREGGRGRRRGLY